MEADEGVVERRGPGSGKRAQDPGALLEVPKFDGVVYAGEEALHWYAQRAAQPLEDDVLYIDTVEFLNCDVLRAGVLCSKKRQENARLRAAIRDNTYKMCCAIHEFRRAMFEDVGWRIAAEFGVRKNAIHYVACSNRELISSIARGTVPGNVRPLELPPMYRIVVVVSPLLTGEQLVEEMKRLFPATGWQSLPCDRRNDPRTHRS
jgi:hypothetical protein